MTDGTPQPIRLTNVSFVVMIVGVAAWLCGNAYEEVVIVPNLAFGDAEGAMIAFRGFFHASNPVVFYAPLGPAVAASSIVHVIASWPRRRERAAATAATACVLIALMLTAWIVVHVNLRLFFGPVLRPPAEAQLLAREWLVLNGVRICLATAALECLRRVARERRCAAPGNAHTRPYPP